MTETIKKSQFSVQGSQAFENVIKVYKEDIENLLNTQDDGELEQLQQLAKGFSKESGEVSELFLTGVSELFNKKWQENDKKQRDIILIEKKEQKDEVTERMATTQKELNALQEYGKILSFQGSPADPDIRQKILEDIGDMYILNRYSGGLDAQGTKIDITENEHDKLVKRYNDIGIDSDNVKRIIEAFANVK